MAGVPPIPAVPAAGQQASDELIYAAVDARAKREHLRGAFWKGGPPSARAAPKLWAHSGPVSTAAAWPLAGHTRVADKRQSGADEKQVFKIIATGAGLPLPATAGDRRCGGPVWASGDASFLRAGWDASFLCACPSPSHLPPPFPAQLPCLT